MTVEPWNTAIRCLNSRITALEELIDVYETTVLAQTEKLFTEIAERKRMEEALLASEARLSAIIDGSPTPMFVIDKEHRVIYWNKALEKYSGIEAGEIVGTNRHWKAFYGIERACVADFLVDGKEQEIPAYYGGKYKESRFIDGAYECADFFPMLGVKGTWFYFTAKVIKDSDNTVIGAVEMFEDISEEKRVQEELERHSIHLEELVADRTVALQTANEKLRREIAERSRAEAKIRRMNDELEQMVADRTSQLLDAQEALLRKEKLATLGSLAGSVGHELRNPLGVMNNAIYFLNTVMVGADDTVREYLDIIKHEIDASQRIITDLLDFARTRTPLGVKVSVHELVEQGLAKCAFPETVDIKTEIPDGLPALTVDPLQMSQVLQNIVTNGIQAMPAGGTLSIAARLVQSSRLKVHGLNADNFEPATDTDTNFIEISVADTGVGITPENMKKMFQPLFTTKVRGIGLGLAVCRNLTEANGGSIGVESRPGEGTTFTVKLPVGAGEA